MASRAAKSRPREPRTTGIHFRTLPCIPPPRSSLHDPPKRMPLFSHMRGTCAVQCGLHTTTSTMSRGSPPCPTGRRLLRRRPPSRFCLESPWGRRPAPRRPRRTASTPYHASRPAVKRTLVAASPCFGPSHLFFSRSFFAGGDVRTLVLGTWGSAKTDLVCNLF
jgi:hypothetical protein